MVLNVPMLYWKAPAGYHPNWAMTLNSKRVTDVRRVSREETSESEKTTVEGVIEGKYEGWAEREMRGNRKFWWAEIEMWENQKKSVQYSTYPKCTLQQIKREMREFKERAKERDY